MNTETHPKGFATFIVIWLGQITSLLGTAMSAFALSIWVFRTTGQVTPLALVSVFQFGSMMILSPLAGAIVDRWDRRLVMIFADLAAGIGTICIFLLYITHNLQIWHLYILALVAGSSNAFHLTAYASTISLLIPKKHFTRASSLITMTEPASEIFAPIIAGILLGPIGVAGVLLIDIISFVFAIGTLLAHSFPRVTSSREGKKNQGNLLKDCVFGFKYIFSKTSLLMVTLLVFMENLLNSFATVIRGPLILVRSGDNAGMMATVLTVEAVGGLAGGLLLGVWGGFKKQTSGILTGIFLGGAGGLVIMALGPLPFFWFMAAFLNGLHIPFVVNSYRTILLKKVPPEFQGRVISSARFISAISIPLSMLFGASLVDLILEPAMTKGSFIATIFGSLLGTSRGSGMSLLYLACGTLCIALCALYYLTPAARNAETLLTDYDLLRENTTEQKATT